MAPALLNLVLLLSLCVTPSTCTSIALETVSTSGSDCVLQCTAVSEPGVQYMAVRWYKVGQPPAPRLSGLLTRDLPNGTTLSYLGVERDVELLGDSHDILLSNLTCADSGVYNCHLSAPVGQQNRDGEIRLILTDCADNRETLVTDACLVIVATAVLMLALLIYLISYVCLKNSLRERNKTTPIKEGTLIDAPLKPLEKKDLMMIYTLGPKSSKMSSWKHICV